MADYEKPVMHGVTASGDKKPILLGNDGGLGLSIEGGVSVDFGTKIDATTMPSGGTGNLGWLSAIWKLINDRIPALVDGKIPVSNSGGGGGDASAANQVTGNTSLASIDTKTPALGQALAASSTPVVLPAAQITALTPPTTVNVAPGSAYLSTAPITRAANTTAYAATAPNFDVYGSLFELQNIGEAGKGIFLSYFEISLNLSAVPSGMTSFAVHLYPTSPTIIADNSIWTIGSDPVLDPIGFNVSMSLAKGGNRVVGVVRDLNQLFILTSSSLWGYLVTNGAIIPAANSETGTIRARSFAP